MNKKILGLIAFVIITVFAVINVNVDMNINGMSDLSLANVKALSIGEGALPYENMKGENQHCALHLGDGWYTASVKWHCCCP